MKNRKQRKTIVITLVISLLILLLSGCDNKVPSEKPTEAVTSLEESESVQPSESEEPASIVYMTTDISAEGLVKIYEALNWTPTGKVAVKLHTGEPPASNYLRAEFVKDLVQYVEGTIVECNTAYSGSRRSTDMHMQVAKDHGFLDIADFEIQDADGSFTLTVTDGLHLEENFVGASFPNYDSYIILSHFKGHGMAGFGGAIKNMSIGLASDEGKSWIHSAGRFKYGLAGIQDHFLESMCEAGKSVVEYLGNGERIIYINVMNKLSADCDCNGNPEPAKMADVGILASYDPVALDKACVDFVYEQKDGDADVLVWRIEQLNGLHTLEYGEEIGLGSQSYVIVSIDED